LVSKLKTNGVLAVVFGRTRLRFVTHLDVSDKDCLTALDIISSIKFN
jgi:hypothetical protein